MFVSGSSNFNDSLVFTDNTVSESLNFILSKPEQTVRNVTMTKQIIANLNKKVSYGKIKKYGNISPSTVIKVRNPWCIFVK